MYCQEHSADGWGKWQSWCPYISKSAGREDWLSSSGYSRCNPGWVVLCLQKETRSSYPIHSSTGGQNILFLPGTSKTAVLQHMFSSHQWSVLICSPKRVHKQTFCILKSLWKNGDRTAQLGSSSVNKLHRVQGNLHGSQHQIYICGWCHRSDLDRHGLTTQTRAHQRTDPDPIRAAIWVATAYRTSSKKIKNPATILNFIFIGNCLYRQFSYCWILYMLTWPA